MLKVGAATPAARLGALSLLCHVGGTIVGGGDGTVTLFDNAGRDYAQTELRGGVIAMSFNADQTEVGRSKCVWGRRGDRGQMLDGGRSHIYLGTRLVLSACVANVRL